MQSSDLNSLLRYRHSESVGVFLPVAQSGLLTFSFIAASFQNTRLGATYGSIAALASLIDTFAREFIRKNTGKYSLNFLHDGAIKAAFVFAAAHFVSAFTPVNVQAVMVGFFGYLFFKGLFTDFRDIPLNANDLFMII